MKRNIGTLDRLMRLGVLAIVIVLYATHIIEGTTAIIFGIIGAIMGATALINFCPLYTLFGFSTHKEEKK
ncbi:MAG: DUF2892 domain-containing protein [Chitinophagales bacterium]